MHEAEAGLMQRRIQREERRRQQKRQGAMIAAMVLGAAVLLAGGVAALGHSAKPAVRSAQAAASRNAVAAAAPLPAVAATLPVVSAAPVAAPVAGPAAAVAKEPKVATATKTPRATPSQQPRRRVVRPIAAAPQRFSIRIGRTGYEPSVVSASSKSPITLSVGKGQGCAAGFVMPSLGIQKDNSQGTVTFSLGKLKPGTYRFNCAMGMVSGRLVVR